MAKIEVIKGDVLSIKEGIIVHGCNCQGVMGGGVALSIRNQFPTVYNLYRKQYELQGFLELGTIQTVNVAPNKYIINAMTQKYFGPGSVTGSTYVSYYAIRECFKQVNEFAAGFIDLGNPLAVCFPKIGAGLGGGDWDIIESIIEEELSYPGIEKTLFIL